MSELKGRIVGTIAVELLEALPEAAAAVRGAGRRMSEHAAEWLSSAPAERLRAAHPVGSETRALMDKYIEATPPWATNSVLTGSNGLAEYKHFLKFPDSDLNQGYKILDIGAGAQQEFARDVRLAKLNATVFSIDPRLALSDAEDTVNLAVSREYRLQGRHFPEPNTFPYLAHATDFPDNFFQRAVSLYSMPMYLKTRPQINGFLTETTRVLDKGGIGTFVPVSPERATVIRHWLDWKGMKGELIVPDRSKNVNLPAASGRQIIYK